VAAPRSITDLYEEQEGYHREIAQGAARRLSVAGLKAIPRVIHGDPRIVLEETARSEQADLVVVGSHGRSGIKKLLLGSVAAHVMTHAPCPVLVIRVPAWKKVDEKRKGSTSEALSV
jgi:nucleotide-binding universal stress UspA family protein